MVTVPCELKINVHFQKTLLFISASEGIQVIVSKYYTSKLNFLNGLEIVE